MRTEKSLYNVIPMVGYRQVIVAELAKYKIILNYIKIHEMSVETLEFTGRLS